MNGSKLDHNLEAAWSQRAGDALDLAREALDDEAEGHFTDAVRVASLLTRQLHELTEAW